MCLIIFKPAGIAWDYQAIVNGFNNNPDGAGVMFPLGGQVHIERGFWDLDTLVEYLDANDLTARDAVLHFRWATHGKINVTNCHPFPVRRRVSTKSSLKTKLGVAHNGIIPGAIQSEYSDTLQFVTSTLTDIKQHIDKAWFSEFVGQATGSKFALMRTDGPVILIGEFSEDDGIFYSNASYRSWAPLAEDDFVDDDSLLMGFCWECGLPTDDELCDACEDIHGWNYYGLEEKDTPDFSPNWQPAGAITSIS